MLRIQYPGENMIGTPMHVGAVIWDPVVSSSEEESSVSTLSLDTMDFDFFDDVLVVLLRTQEPIGNVAGMRSLLAIMARGLVS